MRKQRVHTDAQIHIRSDAHEEQYGQEAHTRPHFQVRARFAARQSNVHVHGLRQACLVQLLTSCAVFPGPWCSTPDLRTESNEALHSSFRARHTNTHIHAYANSATGKPCELQPYELMLEHHSTPAYADMSCMCCVAPCSVVGRLT